jgi:hypothetical protein
MESLIMEQHPMPVIFRVSNPIGLTKNRHTVINYFVDHIQQNITFFVWENVERNIIDIDDSLFGVYNDEEYDRIAPFDKVDNYTTSLSFADMKTAKEFEELVKKAKGNTKSSAYSKATEFEKNNKI